MPPESRKSVETRARRTFFDIDIWSQFYNRTMLTKSTGRVWRTRGWGGGSLQTKNSDACYNHHGYRSRDNFRMVYCNPVLRTITSKHFGDKLLGIASWARQGAAMAVAWLCPAQFYVFGCDFLTRCWSCTNQQTESLPFLLFVFVPEIWPIPAGSGIKPQILSATTAACNSNSNVTFLVSCWPPWTVEEGDPAIFVVKDLGLSLAPKMCPDQSQTFKEVKYW